ncbi:MAG: hypothetical protein ACOCXZ_02665 [Chloroflexota bacterium]
MASSDRELIQIETNEDVNSVRDRLSFYRGRRVLLIWPEEGTALTRRLDLVLIQREAMRRQIRLALVTHDPQVIKNAAELNISTFQTIGASERSRWKRGRSPVFASRRGRPEFAADFDDIDFSHQRRKRPSLAGLLLRMVFLGALLGAAFAVFYAIIPGATVRLTPARQNIEASVQITVNPDPNFNDVDIENAILPATRIRVEVEETLSIPTTGTVNLGAIQALGEVVFVNETNQTIAIPAGTTVSTSAGTPILFRTTADAELPAGVGQEVNVSIEAMQSAAGEIGNVEANLINTIVGPLEERADVINLAPTRDGQSRSQPAVTQADRDRLEAQVNGLLQERAYSEMLQLPQIGEDQLVVLATLRIVEERPEWTEFSAAPGEISESLTLTKRAVVEALVVDTTLGQQIVFARMAQQIPRGRSFQPETVTYQRGDVTFAGDLILFTMSGRGEVVGQINRNQLAEQLTNMTIEEALAYIVANADIAEGSLPEIQITPDLFGRMPLLADRISFELVDAAGSGTP